MPPSKDTAYDEPRTRRLFELLKAVEVANETKDASSSRHDTLPETSDSHLAAPGRRDSQHGTCDSQRLVAHDQELVQCRRKPPTRRLIHLLEAVEVVHEMIPGLHNTLHETSDSHLVAHDDELVRSWRTPHTGLLIQPLIPVGIAPGRRGTRHGTSRVVASGHIILNSELPEVAESGGDFAGLSAHPLSMQPEEGTERKETVEEATETKAEEGMETKETSKSDGDEGAPVCLEKKHSHDTVRGHPSYCGLQPIGCLSG